MFDGGNGDFESVMEGVNGGSVGCGSYTSCDYNNWCNSPPSCTNITEERVVFGLLGGNFIWRKSVIAIGEFNVLNDNIG
jgi:hypothetical protein